jgi:signal recognition particle receptor subunit beta
LETVPVFDPLLRRLIARIVYDGPAFSGKTTNVARLCELLPVTKRTELYTPGALKGRTMFFDWLEVDIGKVGALPVTCQVLSVPGQRARSYRRRPLIHSADVVVYVADSRAGVSDETRRVHALMRRYLRERRETVPYLVQANKRDAEDAMSLSALRALLRTPPHVVLVPAVAASGDGVSDTFNTAVRAALRAARARVSEQGLGGIAGTAENADQLLDALLSLEDQVDDLAAEEDVSEDDLIECEAS